MNTTLCCNEDETQIIDLKLDGVEWGEDEDELDRNPERP